MPVSTTISHLEDGKVDIKTQRLLLRAAKEDDAIGVHEAFSDPEVMQYCTVPHDHPSTTQSWFRKNMLLAPTNGTTDFIVALHTDPDRAIGVIGIHSLESEEIGFILSRQHWGTGIAQEALYPWISI
ncbi:uncharacterized protein A1O5_02118 [Cladophialophora psammophila CBS 110553]|uniref:N-acetyltransferase domain-containing protein n=1 Tax=Cladophialophora psammophila CBS 110553 TaxID=1182543 RepID=W9X4K0_9EURO|nr:uncharacterized protein A1O5_02118 [Cladophialophora psammophila CBS 110553]EXJ75422.1 hypothetical protein A1O5_02118 [Cladophialophora psammophila CBS 110553]